MSKTVIKVYPQRKTIGRLLDENAVLAAKLEHLRQERRELLINVSKHSEDTGEAGELPYVGKRVVELEAALQNVRGERDAVVDNMKDLVTANRDLNDQLRTKSWRTDTIDALTKKNIDLIVQRDAALRKQEELQRELDERQARHEGRVRGLQNGLQNSRSDSDALAQQLKTLRTAFDKRGIELRDANVRQDTLRNNYNQVNLRNARLTSRTNEARRALVSMLDDNRETMPRVAKNQLDNAIATLKDGEDDE